MRKVMLLVVSLTVLACDSEPKRATPQIGSPERAHQDSVLAKSKLPGHGAVDRALDAQTKANAHAAQMDSIQ